MDTTKQINIKNWTYYFYNYIIDIENFDAKLLKINKKSYKDIDVFNIWYVTKKLVIVWIIVYNSVNPLYLGITRVNGYIEEKDSNKYLVFDSTDENKELLKKYTDVFNGIMSKIREIDDDWLEYAKDYMKIKFSSDDDLPLNKSLKFSLMTITIRCVFKEDNELYPQVFLDGILYELQKW